MVSEVVFDPMVRLHHEIDIAASPEAVWKVLGDMDATHFWLPGLGSSRGEAGARRCTTVDGGTIVERISARSDEHRTFAYEHETLPAPVTGSRGVYVVRDAPGGARVVWDSEFTPVDAANAEAVAQVMDGYYAQTLASLKRFVETGRRWNEP